MKLFVATTNPNKIGEVRAVLASARAPHEEVPYEIVTLADVDPVPEPDESGATFWENARIKALAYSQATGLPAVAEDSGLVIDALGGAPGVHSARFLRPEATYADRFAEIYTRLAGRPSAARFVTALAMADGAEILFETETTVEGMVAPAPAGAHGFGYDPVFFYPPFQATTAQLSEAQKTSVSHRARAFRDLARFLARAPRH